MNIGTRCGRLMSGTRMLFRLLLILVAGSLALPVAAADRKAKKKAEQDAADSAPILMAKTGGGDTWADVKELTAAANKGNKKAQAQLGEMLLRGNAEHKVPQDRAKGIELLEKAARAGEPTAAFRIGMLLDDGEVVLQDRARALDYFRSAAAGGEAEAFYNIGAAYSSGRGVKPDLIEALGWLIIAGTKGADPSAEQALRKQLESRNEGYIVTLGEKRAEEIPKELAAKKPAEWLPAALPIVPLNPPASGAPTKSDPKSAAKAGK
jgi:TPR repeat protein